VSLEELLLVSANGFSRIFVIGDVVDDMVRFARLRIAADDAYYQAHTVVVVRFGEGDLPLHLSFAHVDAFVRESGGKAPFTMTFVRRMLRERQTPVVFEEGIANPPGQGAAVTTVASYLRSRGIA
jgi:hypothetical protein